MHSGLLACASGRATITSAMNPNAIPSLRTSRAPRQSPRDALVTGLAAAADRALMRTVALVVQRRILPRDVDLDMLRNSVQAMLDSDLVSAPADFFALPGRNKTSPATRSSVRRRLDDGRVFDRRIDVPYREHPLLRSHAGNCDSEIHVQHWLHEQEEPRGTVVILHGFAMGWPAIDGFTQSAADWYGRGLDVVLLTLPEHGPRRPEDALFSGQNFTLPHAMRLAAAVRQAVFEILSVVAWLRGRSRRPVGLMGMSLGGYLTSLAAGLSHDLDFAVPIVPPACMGDLAWRVYRDTGHYRAGPDPVLNEVNMRAAFFLHSPLAHPLRLPSKRTFIVAGAGDRIVPPEHPSALWRHWGRPDMLWLRGSHMAPLGSRRLVQGVSRHLERLAIL